MAETTKKTRQLTAQKSDDQIVREKLEEHQEESRREKPSGIRIQMKYKFIGVLLFIMVGGLAAFFYFSNRTLLEDKKLFVMDLNLANLRAATAEVKLAIRVRLEDLQILVPRVYRPASTENFDPFIGLPPNLSDEILGITFYRQVREDEREKYPNQKFLQIRQFKNTELLGKKQYPEGLLAQLSQEHPLPLEAYFLTQGLDLLNRSMRNGSQPVDVFTAMLPGSFAYADLKDLIVAVDFVQEFVRKKLHSMELAETFLLTKTGSIFSHPDVNLTIDYAKKAYPHPIVGRLADRTFPREGVELNFREEPHLMNVSETGFTDIFSVSQMKKEQAFIAMKVILRRSMMLTLFILAIASAVTIIFAAHLTKNIRKLKEGAEQMGKGNLLTRVDIKSNDEIHELGESFNLMAARIQKYFTESVEKTRMEEELKTAQLVQSTILMTNKIDTDSVELVPHYVPATEVGGDFWDAYLSGNVLTVIIGDATGHGAPAAIVTAVAKSCVATLHQVYEEKLSAEQFLDTLNLVIYNSCRGKLLMTMCIVQLNLENGQLTICNAGHESPFWLKSDASRFSSGTTRLNSEVLFARGERLGFMPEARYEAVKYQLGLQDTLLFYSDGISEAVNLRGEEWGERSLREAFESLGGGASAAQVKDTIVSALGKFTSGTDQKDDITCIILNWKKRASQASVLKATTLSTAKERLSGVSEEEAAKAVTEEERPEVTMVTEPKVEIGEQTAEVTSGERKKAA